MNVDLLIYLAHSLFWAAFGLTRWFVQRSANRSSPVDSGAIATTTAPYSRWLLAFHSVAFGLMYFGLGAAVLPNRVPLLFAGQRVVGTLIVAIGAGLACWALLYFRSWRLRAKLDEGHQLATGGPFRFVRHPIYLGLDLLALGSAIWVPTPILWISLLLMAIGGDLRCRAEEKILTAAFGAAYSSYRDRTSRFLPGIY